MLPDVTDFHNRSAPYTFDLCFQSTPERRSNHESEVSEAGERAISFTDEEDEDSDGNDVEEVSMEGRPAEQPNDIVKKSSLWVSRTGCNWDDESEDDHLDFEGAPSMVDSTDIGETSAAAQRDETTSNEQPEIHHSGCSPITSCASDLERYDAGYIRPSDTPNDDLNWLEQRENQNLAKIQQWVTKRNNRVFELGKLFHQEIAVLTKGPYTNDGDEEHDDEDAEDVNIEYDVPDGEDLHDVLIRQIIVNKHPLLASPGPTGHMHTLDWKTFYRPDEEIADQFILTYTCPRLCDAVATVMFESDPAALDAFLDQDNWDSFQRWSSWGNLDRVPDEIDDLEEPAFVLWRSRGFARKLLTDVYWHWDQFRSWNSVHWVVDGKTTVLKERGTVFKSRIYGPTMLANSQTEEGASCSNRPES